MPGVDMLDFLLSHCIGPQDILANHLVEMEEDLLQSARYLGSEWSEASGKSHVLMYYDLEL